MKALAKVTRNSVDLESDEQTHLLTDHIAVDVNDILSARRVLKRNNTTRDIILNGGYLVILDGTDNTSFEKAKALVTVIRSQVC